MLLITLMAGLKMEAIVNWRGLKSQGPLHIFNPSTYGFQSDSLSVICFWHDSFKYNQ